MSVLADRVEQLLDDVVTRTGTSLPAESSDSDMLEQPVEEEFRVGAMGLAWDGDKGVLVIEAQAPVEDPAVAEQTLLADVDDGPDALRVLLDPGVGAGLRGAFASGRVGRTSTVPALWPAAGSGRSHLPAAQRLPPARAAV